MSARRLIALLSLAAAIPGGSPAAAQPQPAIDWPSKPIRIVSPLAAGGSGDALARLLGESLAELFRQPVVIENRAGANGIIGVELVARSTPDGYTILVASGGNVAINPALYGAKLPFNIERDLAPVTQIASQNFVAHVSPAFGVTTVAELIHAAKQKPDMIRYASAGSGSTAHLMAVLFETMTGTRMTHVPYKGAPQGRVAVVARECDVMFDGLLATLPLIRAGKLRALGVTGAKRSAAAPDIPTIAEAGVPGYAADAWYGMLVPSQTPKAVISKLYRTTAASVQQADRREKYVSQGVDPVMNAPEEFAGFLKAETRKWAQVVKAAGVRPD